MPMHDAPLSVAFFQHRRSEAAAIDMTRLSVIHHICRYCVLQSCPRSITSQMNLDIAKRVLRVLHLTHFPLTQTCEAIGRSFFSKLTALFIRASFTAASSDPCAFAARLCATPNATVMAANAISEIIRKLNLILCFFTIIPLLFKH